MPLGPGLWPCPAFPVTFSTLIRGVGISGRSATPAALTYHLKTEFDRLIKWRHCHRVAQPLSLVMRWGIIALDAFDEEPSVRLRCAEIEISLVVSDVVPAKKNLGVCS